MSNFKKFLSRAKVSAFVIPSLLVVFAIASEQVSKPLSEPVSKPLPAFALTPNKTAPHKKPPTVIAVSNQRNVFAGDRYTILNSIEGDGSRSATREMSTGERLMQCLRSYLPSNGR